MAKLNEIKSSMSKIQRIVEENTSKLDSMVNTPHVVFLGTTPYFTTFYTQDNFLSTTSVGYSDSYRHTGESSPVRFNKVDNFPIFLESELDKQKENSEEVGWSELQEGTAIALPKTIRVKTDDVFCIEYEGAPIYYKIGKVESTRIRSNPYIKFEFSLYKAPEYDPIEGYEIVITEEQIVDEFKCLYDNIGTEFKTIIRNSDTTIISNALNAITELETKYKDIYYYNDHEFSNMLLYDEELDETLNDDILYSPMLVEFLKRNDIVKNKYGDKLYLEHEVELDRKFKTLYNKSIFSMVENKKSITIDNILHRDYFMGANTYSVLRKTTRNISVLYAEQTMFTTDTLFLSEETKTEINNKTIGDTASMTRIINKYLTDAEMVSDDIDFIKSYEVAISLEDFHLVPIVMFVMQKYCESFIRDNVIESTMV